jgi:hypothetical protein
MEDGEDRRQEMMWMALGCLAGATFSAWRLAFAYLYSIDL